MRFGPTCQDCKNAPTVQPMCPLCDSCYDKQIVLFQQERRKKRPYGSLRALRKGHSITELYRHFDSDGKLLYVGISICTAMRLDGHRSTSRWFDQIATITIERFSSREEAEAAEREAIMVESPLYNVIWSRVVLP